MSGGRQQGGAKARRTKIVCTLGPATFDPGMLEKLARAGMDVARLNFSHGDYEQHAATIGSLRALEKDLGRTIGILQDLSGPKLRVGALPEEGVDLRAGAEVVLSTAERPVEGSIPLPLPAAAEALGPGQSVLLADGQIELEVVSVAGEEISCRVIAGGKLRSHQGIHLPEAELDIATVGHKDLDDLRFGLEHGVDWVAMSFVRRAADLEPLKREIERAGGSVRLMAKIEQHEAVDHLEEILGACDGLMVARGDLGIELPLDRVPGLQKEIIHLCNRVGKPVVTATQMLESMIRNPSPTRAEVSDIANAVLDGTDAVMLSGETAIGDYPVEAVQVMSRVAAQAETGIDYRARLDESSHWPCETVTDGISQASVNLAWDLGASAIITPTATGHTAFMVAMHRPKVPIVAVTPDVATQRRLSLAWGVRALGASRGRNSDEMIVNAIGEAVRVGFLTEGELVVVTAGAPAGVAGHTNLIKVEVVGKYEPA